MFVCGISLGFVWFFVLLGVRITVGLEVVKRLSIPIVSGNVIDTIAYITYSLSSLVEVKNTIKNITFLFPIGFLL